MNWSIYKFAFLALEALIAQVQDRKIDYEAMKELVGPKHVLAPAHLNRYLPGIPIYVCILHKHIRCLSYMYTYIHIRIHIYTCIGGNQFSGTK